MKRPRCVGRSSNTNGNFNNASYYEFKALTDNSHTGNLYFSNKSLFKLYFTNEKKKSKEREKKRKRVGIVGVALFEVFSNLQMSILILKSARAFQSCTFF